MGVGLAAAENAALAANPPTVKRARELARIADADKEGLLSRNDYILLMQRRYLTLTHFFASGCATMNRRLYGLTRTGRD